MTLDSVLIAGGGMAGFATASELRFRGFQGRLTIVDPEGLPYDRPPLSKDYLSGSRSGTEILLAGADWFAERNVSVLTGKAVELHPDKGALVLDDGRELSADRVVLATGAAPRRLAIPGGTLDSVHHLRNRADADRLRGVLHSGARLVILGAGLIGAETASTAADLGAEVTLIDPVNPPLAPAVGAALAERLHRMHTDRGIRVITGIPAAITVDGAGHHVALLSGETIDADAVLVAIGVVPETALAASAGLAVNDGVLVDGAQRTSHPQIYAVGDSARTRLPGGTLLRRAEHWEHAKNTGTTAAAALLGQDLPLHGAPWFWSDRHGVHVEGVGSMSAPGTVIDRARDGVPVASFRLDEGGCLRGCAAIDGGLTVRAARRIIDRGIRVDPAQLADPDVELRKLAR